MSFEDDEWREEANCRSVGLDLFFPDDEGDNPATRNQVAVVCGSCVVREECLEAAMRYEGTVGRDFRHGIWGGLTPVKRVRLAQDRGAKIQRCHMVRAS